MTLRERIVERINDLEADRRRLDALIEELHGLLAVEEAAAVDEVRTPAPKAKAIDAKKPMPATAGVKRSPSVPSSERAVKVARLLSERGPMQRAEIMRALKFDKNAISAAMAGNPWFRKQEGNIQAPWELTEAGRSALAAPG